MSQGDIVRDQLQTRVFDKIGLDATLKTKTSSFNDRGEITTNSYSSGTSIKIVPYNFFQDRQSLQRLGNLDTGDGNYAVQYDVDVEEDDRIEFDGDTYEVVNVEKSYLEKLVVQVLEVTKV